uniref:N-acyl-aliphatic-L-amino acid amidohydrolase n=1 Tax=Musca domestica TaxID=7370 RepID=A0A1I8NC79_MUSDO
MFEPCIKFLCQELQKLEIPYQVHHINGDRTKPVLVGTWLGSKPELPAILLNSHMDVVPVYEDKWTHPPFGGHMDEEGRIYGRGAQDMKCVGAQYLAALRALKKTHGKMQRTVHVVFVPDEETGGELSLQEFVKSKEFRELKVGFALDEGMATEDERYVAYYAERSLWQINFKIKGSAGHGSLLLQNTAGQKFNYLLDKLMTYRQGQEEILAKDPTKHVGDVTTINLTMVNGGIQSNVVPAMLEACFDMRIATDVNLKEYEQQLRQWCEEAGGGIEWEWLVRIDTAPKTKTDNSNPYWLAFEKAFQEMNLSLETHVFPGGTDSQFLRSMGIPSIGFSPMPNTPILMHDHNEYLQADVYLRGIEIYTKILLNLLNC